MWYLNGYSSNQSVDFENYRNKIVGLLQILLN